MLDIKDIYKSYFVRDGIFSKKEQKILKGVSLHVNGGECLGVIGESGSGKSTLGKIILGIEEAKSGKIEFEGSEKRADFRDKMSVVFQDYTSSVNPRFRVFQIIQEPLLRQKLHKKELKKRIISRLHEVGLDESFMFRYPHELSGGQLQRVCIARAISNEPKFLLLDEAVSSLDVSVQVQILELLIKLKKTKNLSYLFITHDLLSVTYICDRVIFFKDGQIVEQINNMSELKSIKNPYSKALLEVYL